MKDNKETKSETKTQNNKKEIVQEKLIAKKDHVIFRNNDYIVIKKGEQIKNLPAEYLQTLKIEKVI